MTATATTTTVTPDQTRILDGDTTYTARYIGLTVEHTTYAGTTLTGTVESFLDHTHGQTITTRHALIRFPDGRWARAGDTLTVLGDNDHPEFATAEPEPTTYAWTLTDTSPDADPNAAPIDEGTTTTYAAARAAAVNATVAAAHSVEAYRADRSLRQEADGTGHRTTLHNDGTRLTVNITTV